MIGTGAVNGVSGQVYTLCVFGSKLYAGGAFTNLGNGATAAKNIAAFDGTAWASLPCASSVGVTGDVNALIGRQAHGQQCALGFAAFGFGCQGPAQDRCGRDCRFLTSAAGGGRELPDQHRLRFGGGRDGIGSSLRRQTANRNSSRHAQDT